MLPEVIGEFRQRLRHPLVSHVFSDRPESSLMTVFSTLGLSPRIAFTESDADVIKTCVRSGFGVGILAGLAVEPGTDDELVVMEIPELFPRLTTWIGYSKDLLLKKYHCEFIRLLAPHLTAEVIEGVCSGPAAGSSGGLPAEVEIPLRNGGHVHRM